MSTWNPRKQRWEHLDGTNSNEPPKPEVNTDGE